MAGSGFPLMIFGGLLFRLGGRDPKRSQLISLDIIVILPRISDIYQDSIRDLVLHRDGTDRILFLLQTIGDPIADRWQGFLYFQKSPRVYFTKKMSSSSWLESEFFSCNDVIKEFDVENVLSSNPFLSTQPVEDPSTYNTHHANICDSVDNFNSGYLAGCPGHSNPVLMATFCDSSRPSDDQSRNILPGTLPSDKRKHKMIERQRRQDMKARLSILKSLLPHENLRGKRSVSDHVEEAVNYVHHLEKKVEDLQNEREKMKTNSDKNAKVSVQGVRLSCNKKFCLKAPAIGGSDREFPTVKIKSMGSAVQVWTNTFEYQIVYSDLLMALEDGGLEVVCATSSTINNRVYHTIHSKVFDLNIFNIDTLYQKVWHLIRTNHTQDQDSQTVDVQA